jgi:hypothetical protein
MNLIGFILHVVIALILLLIAISFIIEFASNIGTVNAPFDLAELKTKYYCSIDYERSPYFYYDWSPGSPKSLIEIRADEQKKVRGLRVEKLRSM